MLAEALPNEVTLLQKHGWRDSRRGGWKKPGKEVEQSVEHRAQLSQLPSLEMLISVLSWLTD